MRQSKTNWSDCVVIQRKIHALDEAMMKYAAGGFQKQGLKDDQFVIVAAIELRNRLNELIERKD
jgi:hypothetical protein